MRATTSERIRDERPVGRPDGWVDGRGRRALRRRRVWLAWAIYAAVLAAVALSAPGGL